MTWTALLPIKARGSRKTRLAGVMDAAARDAWTERMLDRAVDALRGSGQVARIVVLSPERVERVSVEWLPDAGGGLNEEIAAADATLVARPLLVLLPDLPLVTPDDIAALLAAATAAGLAFAFDRHGAGTNAVALADRRALRFWFGSDSRRRFLAADHAVAVERQGLAWDCDTAEDLAMIEIERQPAPRRHSAR